MAKKKAELEAELEELKETVRRLTAHTEVVAVAVRKPEAVSPGELDDAIAGIHGLYERFAA
jgi:dihydroneopterin aldolase